MAEQPIPPPLAEDRADLILAHLRDIRSDLGRLERRMERFEKGQEAMAGLLKTRRDETEAMLKLLRIDLTADVENILRVEVGGLRALLELRLQKLEAAG